MSFSGLGDFLKQLRSKYPALSNRLGEAKAIQYWSEAVGPAIAKHTEVLKVQDSVLWVEVDHPAWKTELHLRKRQILEKIKALSGTESITDLFLIDPKASRSPKAPKR